MDFAPCFEPRAKVTRTVNPLIVFDQAGLTSKSGKGEPNVKTSNQIDKLPGTLGIFLDASRTDFLLERKQEDWRWVGH